MWLKVMGVPDVSLSSFSFGLMASNFQKKNGKTNLGKGGKQEWIVIEALRD